MQLPVDPSHRSRRQCAVRHVLLRDFAEPVCDQRRFDSAPVPQHSRIDDKGKPIERWGRKASGLAFYVRKRGYRIKPHVTREASATRGRASRLWLKGKSPSSCGDVVDRFAESLRQSIAYQGEVNGFSAIATRSRTIIWHSIDSKRYLQAAAVATRKLLPRHPHRCNNRRLPRASCCPRPHRRRPRRDHRHASSNAELGCADAVREWLTIR